MVTILPEINFVNTDAEEISAEVIATYEEYEGRKLSEADPVRIFILAMAKVIAMQNIKINDSAKQNLLHYSRGTILDHKGHAWGNDTARLKATPAKATVRVYISKSPGAKIIKKGTLLTTSNAELMFETTKDNVIDESSDYKDFEVACTEAGVIGNGIKEGRIDRFITPLYFISRVENVTETSGGSEAEDDDNYKERIRMAPEKLSNAGPSGAYEFFAKQTNPLISDVCIDSPEPGLVDIRVLLKGGELPGDEVLRNVFERLSDKKVRPLTDNVTVLPPALEEYDLDISYFISESAIDKKLVQESIERAIEKYIGWQSEKIGRDINPSSLVSFCMKAGAKRVDVRSPTFKPIGKKNVAKLNLRNIHFGGIEDD